MKKKVINYLLLIVGFIGILFLINQSDLGMVSTSFDFVDDEIPISMVIFCEVFVSIHMSVFVLFPLARIINKSKIVKVFIVLFCIRLGILIIGDILFPSTMMLLDFLSVFFGAFIIIPILGFAKRLIYKNAMGFYEYVEMEEYQLSEIGFSNRKLLKRVLVD